MNEEKFWFLVSLRLNGEETEEEARLLKTYLQDHPELKERLSLMTSLWMNKINLPESTQEEFNRHMDRLNQHSSDPFLQYDLTPPQSYYQMNTRKRWALAGGIAAVILIGFLYFYWFTPDKKAFPRKAQNTVLTKPGSRSKVVLPDGTQVWLNADSRLVYDENFSGATRNVQLWGEAYFDVVKVKDHPFIIHTLTIDIKVLGTAFNVRSYLNEKSTETALFRGSVEIIAHNNPERKIILKPFEKLIIRNTALAEPLSTRQEINSVREKPLMTLSKVNLQNKDSIPAETLWISNKLSFDGESLEEAALKIERWYDVKVIITDDKLRQKLYTAVFDNEDLHQVMEALRLTGNFKYSIDKKEVIIQP